MSVAIGSDPRTQTADTDPVDEARQAERATLGALLLVGTTRQLEILSIVKDTDFGDPFCGWVIAALRRMVRSGHPVDQVTFAGWVDRHGLAPLARSRATIRTELYAVTMDCPEPANGAWYAAQVVEQSARRRVITAAARTGDGALGGDLTDVRHRMVIEYTDALLALDRAIMLMA